MKAYLPPFISNPINLCPISHQKGGHNDIADTTVKLSTLTPDERGIHNVLDEQQEHYEKDTESEQNSNSKASIG